jgi:antitoxin YqcF
MSGKDAPISSENKQIARHVASVFGGTARVDEYTNSSDTLAVGILSTEDRPVDGVTSYSTIKLSDHPMARGSNELPVRLELAGGCESSATAFANLMASAAFRIIQTDMVYRPGTAIPDLVLQSGVSSTLPHLYLTAPFLWGDALNELDCGTKKVTWLLAMPISETEYRYLQEHGDDAFESILEAAHVDVFDPDRPPAT